MAAGRVMMSQFSDLLTFPSRLVYTITGIIAPLLIYVITRFIASHLVYFNRRIYLRNYFIHRGVIEGIFQSGIKVSN